MAAGISVRVVPWDDRDAAALRDEQQAEVRALYDGEGDIEANLPAQEMLTTVLVDVDGTVAGGGSLREATRYGPGWAEIKRMYVRPAHRLRGLARILLTELERLATAELGLTRLILETGVRQVEAIALYRSAGYRRIASFGPYREDERAVCYGRRLHDDGTRVLVLNGTMGAGKTTIASAVSDALRERGVPHVWLDADALGQSWPPPADDPFDQRLVLDNLASIAPNLAARGLRTVVVPRVVEDPADRERYERIFDGADVRLVRLRAGEQTRLARLTAREPEGRWRDFAHARTRELEANLERLALDDAVVDNDGRPADEVAEQVLTELGW